MSPVLKVILFFGAVVILVAIAYMRAPHGVEHSYLKLDPDAKVSHVNTERDGRSFVTTVYFMDGYKYISREHWSIPGYIVVDSSIQESIKKDAIRAHAKACEEKK